jgi:hypothetical protein
LFGPAGGDIDAVDGIGEHTREGLTAMGDGIGFEEAGAGLVPLVGLDRDVFSEEGSWFGGAAASFLVLDTDGVEESIDGSCRDAVQGSKGLRRQRAKGLDVAREPERQESFEAF